MLTLSSASLIVIGIVTTAVAQLLLKKASAFEVATSSWILWMGLSAASYAVSFVAYSRILKYFALNKIYPAMTIAQIIVITLCGLWLGEVVGSRQLLGLVLGVAAIYLILG